MTDTKLMTGNQADVIIIGAGPSGIFCAYELIKEKAPELLGNKNNREAD